MQFSATGLLVQHSNGPTEAAGDFPSTTIPSPFLKHRAVLHDRPHSAETFAKARPPPGQLDMFKGWSDGIVDATLQPYNLQVFNDGVILEVVKVVV